MFWKHLLVVPTFLAASLGGSQIIDGSTDYIASSAGATRIASRSISRSVSPDRLYTRVWSLINDDYYDTTYNHQDWNRWEHHYDGKLKTLDDSHRAIETMLSSLGDRYTRFLDQEAFDDEKSQIDAKLYGIGVQIGLDKNQKIIIVTPIDDTPAFRAGLQPADEVLEINGRSTKGYSVEDAAKRIRGPINSDVVLTILRQGKKLKIAVTRAEIPIRAVQTKKMLDADIGYIRLSSFISQQANKEMRDALTGLNSAKGIILDLRDNPGGLLTNAIDISNMFLDDGVIVSTVDRDGYKQQQQSDGRPVCRLPLVVLINKGSASASEIASGALRDNGRAILVGQTTFGKGLVQGINRLEDGTGVNLTIARYLTPNDNDIHKKGIVPDVLVEVTDKDTKDGKGPWWLDPEGPAVKRAPEDMKDIQLKAASEAVRKQFGHGSHVALKSR